MKSTKKIKKKAVSKITAYTADHTSPDADADKTGTDANSDCTSHPKGINKFDKPKREMDPDTTGIDVDSDKTKKERPAGKKKRQPIN
jgi:hypothetical protein